MEKDCEAYGGLDDYEVPYRNYMGSFDMLEILTGQEILYFSIIYIYVRV